MGVSARTFCRMVTTSVSESTSQRPSEASTMAKSPGCSSTRLISGVHSTTSLSFSLNCGSPRHLQQGNNLSASQQDCRNAGGHKSLPFHFRGTVRLLAPWRAGLALHAHKGLLPEEAHPSLSMILLSTLRCQHKKLYNSACHEDTHTHREWPSYLPLTRPFCHQPDMEYQLT